MEDKTITNRIALVGSAVAILGFFFLPLIELKPNRIASGVTFNLLELQGDWRYLMLFGLVLAAFGLALRGQDMSRAWLLALIGNLTILLTLVLPAIAGEQLLANAADFFAENERLRNPRLLPSAAIACGLIGGYIILYGGIKELEQNGTTPFVQAMLAFISLPILGLFYTQGRFEVYSIVVEFNNNGALLNQRFLEHITFVAISILTGSIIGIGLGLWASRDERLAPVILYAVGIIQTIPSLALFGLLLLPLARLGDRLFVGVLGFFLLTLLLAAALMLAYLRLAGRLPQALKQGFLLLSTLALAVPLALFTIVLVSFLFRISLLGLTNERFTDLRGIVQSLVLAAFVLWLGFNRFKLTKRLPPKIRPYTRYFSGLILGITGLVILLLLYRSAVYFLRNVSDVSELTIRNLGVSGIGVAPALIALTLYALLPIVRNTYAGLNNVDPAVIDSGRGMGMTARQIFFRIELPLALPVIMAGVRNAGVALVGIGTIASVIGGGGLGDFVLQGIINTSIDLILLGTIPAVILALILDGGLRAIESLLTSPGIKQEQT